MCNIKCSFAIVVVVVVVVVVTLVACFEYRTPGIPLFNLHEMRTPLYTVELLYFNPLK